MKNSKASKLIAGIILVIAGAGLLVWVVAGRQSEAPTQEDHSSHDHGSHDHSHEEAHDNEEAETNGEVATITYTDDGFEPSALSITKGTVVTVKNDSSKRVQFSSGEHPTHQDNPEMNLRVLQPGESASFTAVTVGEHNYHDHIDASKTGVLTVTE